MLLSITDEKNQANEWFRKHSYLTYVYAGTLAEYYVVVVIKNSGIVGFRIYSKDSEVFDSFDSLLWNKTDMDVAI